MKKLIITILITLLMLSSSIIIGTEPIINRKPVLAMIIYPEVQVKPIVPAAKPKIASRGDHLVQYTQKEKDLVARVIHGEAESQPKEGQLAIVNVILNRLAYNKRHPKDFSDTIKGLLTYTQFNCVGRKNFYTEDIPDEFYKLADEGLYGDKVISDDVLYFYNPKTAGDKWIRSLKKYKQIGDHLFCYGTSK